MYLSFGFPETASTVSISAGRSYLASSSEVQFQCSLEFALAPLPILTLLYFVPLLFPSQTSYPASTRLKSQGLPTSPRRRVICASARALC